MAYTEIKKFFELTDDLFCLLGADGYFKTVNKAWGRLLGWSEAELLSKPFIEFVVEADREKTLAVAQALLATGEVLVAFENRYMQKNGGTCLLQWNAVVVSSGIVAVARDVTVSKRDNLLLDQTQKMAQVGGWAMDLITKDVFWTPEAYAIHDLDPAGKYDFGAYDVKKYFPGLCGDVMNIAIDRLFTQGTSFDLELDFISNKGRKLFIRSIGQAIIDKGVVTKCYGSFQDITNQHAAAVELRNAANRMQVVLDGANLGSWDWDLVSNAVSYDKRWCEMLGLGVNEIEQTLSLWDSLVHPDDKDECYRIITEHLEGKTSYYECPHRLKHTDGEYRWVYARGKVTARDDKGKPTRLSGTHLDITDQKAQEQRVLSSSRLASLGEMAASIAHEVNNPLAIIMGKASQLRMMQDVGAFDKKIFSTTIDKIEQTCDRIAKIIRGLKSFSRNSEKDPFTLENVKQLVSDVLSFASQRIKERGVELRLDIDPIYTIECRPSQIQQVILNLLNNSCDAVSGSAKAWIEISATIEGDIIRITVTDSGAGIPEPIRQKIMEPFYTTKTLGMGTGLGLSISKGIIEEHGGTIQYVEYNGHTRFVAEMPIKQAQLGNDAST